MEISRHARYVALLALIAGLFACAGSINREELLNRMQGRKTSLIVDVRSRSEYGRGHLPGAVHIPFYAVASTLSQMQFPKDGEIVMYCEHGPRAGLASLLLHLSGYDALYSLEGHMKSWRQNQFPIETINP